ncbi:hypothetical protein CBS14141_003871 [Malassezia furfur]|nr:hypothetical protein CBS14141_003871 [Malassezia furfur]
MFGEELLAPHPYVAGSHRSQSPWTSHQNGAARSPQSPFPPAQNEGLSPLVPEEDESGNIEYKLQILPVSADRFDRLVTQLSWRLTEGGGSCVYELGVRDDGALVGISLDDMRQSLTYLCAMAQNVGAHVSLQRLITKTSTDTSETTGFDTLHIATTEEEVRSLLELQKGLPPADAIDTTICTDALAIELVSPTHATDLTLPFVRDTNKDTHVLTTQAVDIPTTTTNSKTPSAARQCYLDSRRVRRLARFDATIQAGAGRGETPTRLDSPRPISDLCAPLHVPGALRFLVEATIVQDEGLFVDYTSL